VKTIKSMTATPNHQKCTINTLHQTEFH